MLHSDKIARLNELAKKSKITTLNPDELKEQQQLRQEYMENFRSTFRGHLERIHLVDEDGNE